VQNFYIFQDASSKLGEPLPSPILIPPLGNGKGLSPFTSNYVL